MDDGLWVEGANHAVDFFNGLIRNKVGFVDEDDVGEFDLIVEKVDDGSFVFFSNSLPAVFEGIPGREITQEVGGVDYGDHGVDLCDVSERLAGFVCKGEGFGDGHGFGDSGGFDDEVVEAVFAGEFADFE